MESGRIQTKSPCFLRHAGSIVLLFRALILRRTDRRVLCDGRNGVRAYVRVHLRTEQRHRRTIPSRKESGRGAEAIEELRPNVKRRIQLKQKQPASRSSD